MSTIIQLCIHVSTSHLSIRIHIHSLLERLQRSSSIILLAMRVLVRSGRARGQVVPACGVLAFLHIVFGFYWMEATDTSSVTAVGTLGHSAVRVIRGNSRWRREDDLRPRLRTFWQRQDTFDLVAFCHLSRCTFLTHTSILITTPRTRTRQDARTSHNLCGPGSKQIA